MDTIMCEACSLNPIYRDGLCIECAPYDLGASLTALTGEVMARLEYANGATLKPDCYPVVETVLYLLRQRHTEREGSGE